MNKKKRAQYVETVLNTLFPDPAIPLTHTNPYTLLIAVLLSAQCTDARVNTVTPHLPTTPEQMVAMTVQEIAAIIRPCGLSQVKSRALWQLSKDLIEHHQSQVPNTFAELEQLPGVGHKTASVVMAQSFREPAFPVDTHIYRCAHRWGLSKGKTVAQVEKDLKRLFAKQKWIKLHLQIIYFARAYCPARGHKKEQCPICHFISSN